MDLGPIASGSAPYLAAFLAGLLGGVHCVGMCGGIVGALVHALPAQTRAEPLRLLVPLLCYNFGRLVSYTLAGALVGGLGMWAGDLLLEYGSWYYLRLAAGALMVGLGLYLGGWWPALARVERIGAWVWSLLRPLATRLLPVRSPAQAIAAGALWGWLPCGLVYTSLVWAFSSGGWVQGAGFLLAFGLGTLPTLLAAGLLLNRLSAALQGLVVRRAAGLLVVALGLWTIAVTLVLRPNVGLGCALPGA